MSSKEKREILQNTPFSIVAGLVMGGPGGAIATGMLSLGLAALEEKRDNELRQKEKEIFQRPSQEEIEIRQKLIVDKINQMQDASACIREIVNEISAVKLQHRVHLEHDILANGNYQRGMACPDGIHNHVKVLIYNETFGWMNGNDPVIKANGIIMTSVDFCSSILNDINNLNFKLFDCCRQKFHSTNIYYLRYMYTIDEGNTFNIYV